MDFKQNELKWQEYWRKNDIHEPSDDYTKKKKYILSMLPYPSGRIHMGHVRNYSIGDAIARYYRQLGFNVLHPIGWDSFGMPAENAAISKKIHPKKWTYENIDYMRDELMKLGLSFSRKREFATSDPLYTKHEQYLFIKMYEKGLIYRKNAIVNWCEHDNTTLANEQVEDGCCWRCGNEVTQKEMPGYYFKISNYAQELLDELNLIKNGWPNKVVTMQENWIGRSKGLEFKINLEEKSKEKLNFNFDGFSVFTTRPDTIFGITYTALAPEHEIVKYMIEHQLLSSKEIDKIKQMQKLSQRAKQQAKKDGFDLGIKVVHPITCEILPVWVANFVLIEYGEGAVMSVPAHDERDYEFASEFNLPIKQVIKSDKDNETLPYRNDGILINSLEYDNLSSADARKKIIKLFEDTKQGTSQINYKLKDWGISRQRYWGAPIPIVHCDDCGLVLEKKENLPITLPDDIEITGIGNPLNNHPTWKHTTCPKCGKKAIRETDTMDTFVQSSWYFLRYATNPKYWEDEAFNINDMNYWMGVDQYIGGVEHAIMHLLYSRYFIKILRDLKLLNCDEPFDNLLTQGMVLKDGFKMSKSKGNVVDPDSIINTYGADTARLFMLFASPPQKELVWNDNAVEGAFKFINKFVEKSNLAYQTNSMPKLNHDSLSKAEKKARKYIYEALQRAENTYTSTFAFNTLIASCMQALNALSEQENEHVWTQGYFVLLKILEPIIPHVCWELSEKLFNFENFKDIPIDESAFKEEIIKIAVTINGKKRAEFEINVDDSEDNIIKLAKQNTQKWLDGKKLVKEFYVKNKLVNLVVK